MASNKAKADRRATILTITGSDSTGGSGIQADIKTITALGAYAASAITSVTAQDTGDIRDFHDLPATIIEQQVQPVMDDLPPDAVKVGLLRSVGQVEAVERLLRQYEPRHVVLDVVPVSSHGNVLMPPEVIRAVTDRLFPLSSLITLKLRSALHLLGKSTDVRSNEGLERVARRLLDKGGQAVVVQGGNIVKDALTDVLVAAEPCRTRFFIRPGFIDRNTHGAGGAFSAATAVFLARGKDMEEAVGGALDYLSQLILRSVDSGLGGQQRLLDHGGSLSQPAVSTHVLELYNHLMNAIACHHRQTSDVGFYADLLNITPRYLAQITRRIAGRTPKQLIDGYIIKEVEVQLCGTSRNIQEIAFHFGFSSQAQFNKFFRKMRGCTPTAFRRQHL